MSDERKLKQIERRERRKEDRERSFQVFKNRWGSIGNSEADMLKFHWEKWRNEAKSFGRRSGFISAALILIILYLRGAIQWKFPWINNEIVIPAENITTLKRWFFFPIGLWLLFYMLHGFVDLMRHRVPEEMEPIIHNNWLDVGSIKFPVPLLTMGRSLYLISFLFYFAFLAIWLGVVTFGVFTS